MEYQLKNHKLGMLPPKPDERLMSLRDHLVGPAPPVPSSVTAFTEINSWPMMMNDTVGCCTISEAGHIIQYWTRLKNEEIMSDAETVKNYSAICGYNPDNPASDIGAMPEDVLNYWVKSGMEAGGKTDLLNGYAQIENVTQNLMDAIAWTGPVYAGVQLPNSAEQLFEDGRVWDVVPNDTIVGGHAIPLVGYFPGYFVTVTWGKIQILTTAWWKAYGIVTYGLLSKDNVDPELGINWDSLQANMNLIQKA